MQESKVRIVSDLENVLSMWLRERSSDPTYSGALIEDRQTKSTTFAAGEETNTEEQSLIARVDVLKNGNGYFFAYSEEDVGIERIRAVLQGTKYTGVKTTISAPKGKLKFPKDYNEKEPSQEIIDISEWKLDGNLLEDLKAASKIPVDSRRSLLPKTTAMLECSTFYFKDSQGYYLQWSVPTFHINLQLKLSEKRSIQRYTGFSPHNEGELKNVYVLLPYIQDITLDQRFRASHDFVQLMRSMESLSNDLEKQQVMVKSKTFNAIIPMTTFPHEVIGHMFEEKIETHRTFVEDSRITERDLFATGQIVGPSSLTIKDNPKTKVKGIPLVATRAYDMEGFQTSVKHNIDGGRVTNQKLGSRYSRGNNVGNAWAYSLVIPQPRMSITETLPDSKGPKTIEEFIELAGGEAIVCIRNQGWVDPHTGLFVLGEGGGPKEYSYDTEVFHVKKTKGDIIYSPIKMPHIICGIAYQSLGGIVLGNGNTLSYDPAFCESDNPVSRDNNDRIYSSQIGPMALLPDLFIRELGNREITKV